MIFNYSDQIVMIYATYQVMKLRNSKCVIGYIGRISRKRIINSIKYIDVIKMRVTDIKGK